MVIAGVRMAAPGWVARPDAAPIAYVTDEALKGRPAVDGVVPMVDLRGLSPPPGTVPTSGPTSGDCPHCR